MKAKILFFTFLLSLVAHVQEDTNRVNKALAPALVVDSFVDAYDFAEPVTNIKQSFFIITIDIMNCLSTWR